MKLIVAFLLITNAIFSQESKFRIIGEEKINDSLIMQTAELMIFNNTGYPICLRVSTAFRSKILSRDTIELGPLNSGNGCLQYNLLVSKEDIERGFNENPSYPLVLNSRTCLVATVNLLRNLKCKNSWIEYSYINQQDIDYNDLLNKYSRHEKWNADPKLKYRSRKILF